MRRLVYVPIIHQEVDLGSAGAALARKGAALSGERRWALHRETVDRFWEGVAAYLLSLDPGQLRVYQDGLAADGEVGRQIVAQAAARGSKNYQLVLEMLNRGAQLRKTEDPVLLLQEQGNLHRFLRPESAGGGRRNHQEYRLDRDRLMEQRDRFIAEAIGATLREGEVGVLFIGANHQVVSRLAGDISVEMVKDRERVQAYLDELFLGHDDRELEKLAQYLLSPPGFRPSLG